MRNTAVKTKIRSDLSICLSILYEASKFHKRGKISAPNPELNSLPRFLENCVGATAKLNAQVRGLG